jgi:hypothetical protein
MLDPKLGPVTWVSEEHKTSWPNHTNLIYDLANVQIEQFE